MPPLHRLALTLASASFLALSSQAATINWGNAPSSTLVNFASDGVAIDASSGFDFGVFDIGGPVGAPSTWRAQFTVLDSLDGTNPYNPALQAFDATWIGTDDSFADRQAAIWVHNMDFTATPASEWAVITADDWIIPRDNGQQTTPLEFRITDLGQTTELLPADTILWGGLQGTPGPGVVTNSPAGFSIQTHTFPIPEPSTALLLLGGLSILRFRRQRS